VRALIRGRLYFSDYAYGTIAKAWPKKRGAPKDWATHWNSQQFRYAAFMTAYAEPMSWQTAKFLTTGTDWMPRDLLTRAAYGTAYEIVLLDGTTAAVTPKGAPPENW
jgi:ABC-type dipeptide/oligopeptide/nickel transport system permease subunit